MSTPGPLAGLDRHPSSAPALSDGAGHDLDRGGLRLAVERAMHDLDVACAAQGKGAAVVAILSDNGLPAAVAALAVGGSGHALLALPTFFTAAQVRHALDTAGARVVLTDRPGDLPQEAGCAHAGSIAGLELLTRRARPVDLPPGTATITFTSGTTGTPKGVCLGAETIGGCAEALRVATGMRADDRHLAVLPLSILLEEVGGLRRALSGGATVVLPPLASTGLQGSSTLQPRRLAAALATHRATSAILTPQMLAGLVEALEQGVDPPPALRFLGVGGASVPTALLRRARALGLPAFEGYGLTEAGSVVTLNVPGADRPGTVGRPLAHVRVRLARDGEVLVAGHRPLGVLGGDSPDLLDGWLATGDLGALDEDGFLRIQGRKRNIFITSFGRNVCPEWIERELLGHSAVAAAAVFGEGWPAPRAVIVPAPGRVAELDAAVAAANDALPDYARIERYVVADMPFSTIDGQATPNGRPCRTAIQAAYGARLEAGTSAPQEVRP